MTVQEKIKSVLEGIGENYLYDSYYLANMRLDKMSFPVVLNVLPISGSLTVSGRQIKESVNCLIAFMEKCNLDENGEDMDVLMEKCKTRAKRFILELYNTDYFDSRQITNISYQNDYGTFDVHACSVILQCTLVETVGDGICYKNGKMFLNE